MNVILSLICRDHICDLVASMYAILSFICLRSCMTYCPSFYLYICMYLMLSVISGILYCFVLVDM